LTEPNAGTDLQALTTKATRVGDKYVIEGAKTWISNSIEGQVVALLCKTDPSAQPRYKGMSILITQTKNPETMEDLANVTNGTRAMSVTLSSVWWAGKRAKASSWPQVV